MLWRGISIEPEWVVLALLVIAVALGRGRSFVVDWAPFLPLPTITLQHAFYRSDVVSPQDLLAMFFYFMHFPLPIVVGFIFWVRSRTHYRRFIAALLLMAVLAFITYLFWPSAPPWYQFQASAASGEETVHKILNETVDKLWGPNYWVSPLYSHLNPNKFAAFPSLHAAFPALAAVYAWRRYRWLSIALIAWTLAVALSIVYLGEHYVVDILDGLLYVAVATIIVEAVTRWRSRHGAPSTPAKPSA
jgi:membrane-associated phospholipid phosphatase